MRVYTRSSRNAVQALGICTVAAMMFWRATTFCFGTSTLIAHKQGAMVQHHPLRPLPHFAIAASEHSTNMPVSLAAPIRTEFPVALAAAAVSLLCAFCGQRGMKRCRDTVRCHAGFQGSGLSGKWGCYKTEGDIDAYWKATGLPWLARKGLQLMDWGAGKNQNIREFLQDGDSIRMDYSFDGPGLGGLGFTETYTVGSGIQEITRMGGAKILVEPAWESDSVLRVQNMNPAKQTKGWAKTLLSGGQDEETEKQMVDGETSEENPSGDVIDIHRFYLEDSSLVLEADSSPSGGPVVKWFLKKLS